MKAVFTGPNKLNGHVAVSGAKNSATRVLAASLLADGPVTLRNFPTKLEDVKAKVNFIRKLGVRCEMDDAAQSILVEAGNISFDDIDDYALPIRTTYLLAAAGLVASGLSKIPYPGGCKIGSRGYDLHVMVWQDLGCVVTEKEEYIEVTGKLRGGQIDFPISTVGGTETALICGAVADGETVVRNAYVTPEVQDLIDFLREMGAEILVEGNSLIRIRGAGGRLGQATFTVMPDRIEALTWIILGAVTGGAVHISNIPFDTLKVPLIHLREAAIDVFCNSGSAFVSPACIGPNGIQPFELACGTHPGVHTDMQSFFTLLALFANGRSTIHDYRYPERIQYAAELDKFSPGSIKASPGVIRVDGNRKLAGAHACSTDLRGSMALVMAALCAEGRSEVSDVELALRGYNNLPEKLSNLGVACEWSR